MLWDTEQGHIDDADIAGTWGRCCFAAVLVVVMLAAVVDGGVFLLIGLAVEQKWHSPRIKLIKLALEGIDCLLPMYLPEANSIS